MTFSDTFAVRNHQSSHMHSIITSCLPILTTLFLSAPPSDEPVTATPDSIPEQILEEVVVKARRPQVIVTPEKISFNPSATLAGSNGTLYDALSSMPGVSVNGSTISAFGQSGVTLTVDGRKFMLQGNALESYLKSLPVSNIERIELVTAPAARSDASSSSTVLNVKLRRTRQAGMTFGASANLQGWRARRGLGTAFFNYSNARTSVMLSAAYALSRNPSVLLTDRPYLDGDLRILQTYHRYRTDRNKNTSVYIDHNFSGRWSGGLSFSGNRFNRSECGLMDTRLSDDSRGNHTVNHTRLGSSNLSGGLYLKDTFEDHRGNLSIGFDYFSSCNDESQDISDTFGTATEGEMNGSVRGYITTVDFTRQLSEPWFLSAGAKSTILRIGNEGNYNESGGGDDDLSSRFRGHENVNAIYMESRFAPAPVLALTAGIRLEQTNVRNRFSGNETSGQSDFSRHSAGIFCNVNLSSRLTDRDAVMLSYVRRVKRPDYSDLNPFVYIMDDITHYGGNINLREATSDNFRLVYTRDNLLRCGLSYSYINNDIVRFFREVAGKTVYSSPENI
ncbi:MAG: outer membrane beta-barrel protein, partial [Duncaniella sp.]|nr:outer membrane beta-barrel protein [Duncaniella sp.]